VLSGAFFVVFSDRRCARRACQGDCRFVAAFRSPNAEQGETMTRSSMTLALALAALALHAPPAVAGAGAQPIPATASAVTALAAAAEPGGHVALQQAISGR
jgi:hypothetical protein